MRQLFRELKRRNVYKVAVAYAAVAFIVWQAADLLFPALRFPAWTIDFVIVLTLLGFPVAVVLAWAFEMTPEGVRRTATTGEAGDASASEEMSLEERRDQSRLAMTALVGLGLVGAAVVGGWHLMGGGGESSPETAVTTDTASTKPQLGDRSIAVLPFEALGQQEPDAFTEGMHDDLLARLSNVSGLKVISRTAVEQYQDTDLSTGDIADSLGVRWVLEGGVQEMSDQIQVNAQLIDPRTETHAWADTHRRDLTAANLFDLQSEITKRIARSLEAQLSPEETERVERRPTEDLDAYRLYVRGRGLLDRRTAASIDSARDFFQQAIDQDSTYALAWAGLADARSLEPAYTNEVGESFGVAMRAALPEAETAARRALELERDLADAHASLGLVYYFEQLVTPTAQNASAGLRELRRAVDLRPSYAQAHAWLGRWLLDLGRPGAALRHYTLAVELNPENYPARRSFTGALLANGKYEEALAEARRFREMYPEREAGPALEAAALVHLNRWEQVSETVRPYVSETHDSPLWASTYLALAEVASGDTASARSRLQQLRMRLTSGFAITLVEAGLGNDEGALSALLEADIQDLWTRGLFSVLPRSGVQGLRYNYPDVLRSVRGDPRYRKLIRDLNVAWGLNPDGSLPDSVDVSFDSAADE